MSAGFGFVDDGQLLEAVYGNIALVRRTAALTGREDDCLFMALRAVEELRARGGMPLQPIRWR